MTVNDASGLPPESPGRPSTRAELEEVKISFSSKKKEEMDFFMELSSDSLKFILLCMSWSKL